MRQGDGSDLLGPGDPRNAEIGILYVDPRDNRQEVLTAINTQELQGRKQIAIVLPEQGQAFRQPFDFEGLKKMRRQLQAQIIFIAPSGPGPAEFARQRRFAVYSSLDNFKTALLSEGIPQANPRVKSRPGGPKRAGILGFGKERDEDAPAPSTPRSSDAPAPLVMPTTPRPSAQANIPVTPQQSAAAEQANMPTLPVTPRGPQPSQAAPAQNIGASKSTDNSPASGASPKAPSGQPGGAQPKNGSQGKPGAQPKFPPTSGLEDDDDALYTPSTQGNAPAPIAQGSATPTGSPRRNTPGKLPAENQGSVNIIAFPSAPPATPRATGKTQTPRGKRASGKMPPAPAQPAPDKQTNATKQPGPDQGNGSAPGSPSAGGNGQVSTQSTVPQAGGGAQAGNAPGVAQPAPTQSGSSTGKSVVVPASGGEALRVSNAVNVTPGAASGQRQRGKRGQAANAQSGGTGGPGNAQRPAGLTPLPPPYSRRQRRKRNRVIVIAALILILILLGGSLTWGVLAQRGVLPGIPGVSGILPGNVSATVTITPISKLENDSYILTGVTKGTPDPTRLQIAARQIAQTSATQTATAHATGSLPAETASGQLKFFNSTVNSVTLGSTVLTGKDGVKVAFNGPVTVPGEGTIVVTGSAVNAGSSGNISAGDISGNCCWTGISVGNPSAFSGGRDPITNSIIEQSDITNAAQPLITTLTKSTQADLAKQVKSNEHAAADTLQCKPAITSSQQPGSVAKTATVGVTLTCTEEVYDFTAAQRIATSRLQSKAQIDPALGPQYQLDGQIVASVSRVTATDGQLSIEEQAKGLWVYQLNAQLQQNIKQALVKLSKAAAQNVLKHEMGVASATISLSSGNAMPANASDIKLVIQSLPGAQATPPGPGTPTANPTILPTGPVPTPTTVNGSGQSGS